ncbi:hypothetical protein AAFC00_002913 [Neodothiora populina]|uniref:Uncharacterized protein n=1 Tax=Neodothiora populina TaxID=2781224 RepID=A0ABR3P8Y6_9PEZI
MCYHKLYIFTTCGHSFYSAKPLVMCRHASIDPTSSYSRTCETESHPFQTLNIERLCTGCERQRSELLERLESRPMVRFDEWQWKVSYGLPEVDMTEQRQHREGKKKNRNSVEKEGDRKERKTKDKKKMKQKSK